VFTVGSLASGQSYHFKMQSRTAAGFSDFSSTVVILAASTPSKPNAPVTIWSNQNNAVTVTWTEPSSNGTPILSYTVLIRKSDGLSFATELTGCNSSNSALVTSRQCVIAVANLVAAPFNLPYGSSIFAKIVATNIKGDSIESNAGNGAIIVTIPDPPINLVENLS